MKAAALVAVVAAVVSMAAGQCLTDNDDVQPIFLPFQVPPPRTDTNSTVAQNESPDVQNTPTAEHSTSPDIHGTSTKAQGTSESALGTSAATQGISESSLGTSTATQGTSAATQGTASNQESNSSQPQDTTTSPPDSTTQSQIFQTYPEDAPTPSYNLSLTSPFSLALFKEVMARQPGNVVMSPLSVWAGVGLTGLGAGGATSEQVLKALGVQDKIHLLAAYRAIHTLYGMGSEAGDVGERCDLVGRLCVDHTAQIAQCVSQVLHPHLQLLDFSKAEQTATTINHFINSSTNGHIPNLLDVGSVLAAQGGLIIANAAYFKGSWRRPFEPARPRKWPFKLEGGGQAEVNMMTVYGWFMAANSSELGASILELPYKQGRFSMYILLPLPAGSQSSNNQPTSSQRTTTPPTTSPHPTNLTTNAQPSPSGSDSAPIRPRKEGNESQDPAFPVDETPSNPVRRSAQVDEPIAPHPEDGNKKPPTNSDSRSDCRTNEDLSKNGEPAPIAPRDPCHRSRRQALDSPDQTQYIVNIPSSSSTTTSAPSNTTPTSTITPATTGTLDSVVERLTADRLEAALSSLHLRRVEATVPTFSLNTALDTTLIQALSGVGIIDLFSSKANLTAFAPDGKLRGLSGVHRAVINVDELGTEAAASTAILVGHSAHPPPRVYFTCDQPFLFMLRDTANEDIIFMGAFKEPQTKA